MNLISRTITGVIGILLGIFLIVLSFLFEWSIVFYGVAILIIGLFILLNWKEDKIEQIKSKMGGKK